jgi:hypothetical protein
MMAGFANELQWAEVRENGAALAIKEDFNLTRKWFEVGGLDAADPAANEWAFRGMFLARWRREKGRCALM